MSPSSSNSLNSTNKKGKKNDKSQNHRRKSTSTSTSKEEKAKNAAQIIDLSLSSLMHAPALTLASASTSKLPFTRMHHPQKPQEKQMEEVQKQAQMLKDNFQTIFHKEINKQQMKIQKKAGGMNNDVNANANVNVNVADRGPSIHAMEKRHEWTQSKKTKQIQRNKLLIRIQKAPALTPGQALGLVLGPVYLRMHLLLLDQLLLLQLLHKIQSKC